jgi:hypothetical protein
MTHNVPAVYDVLPARIRALRSKDQGWQYVPEQRRGNEASRNDLAVAEAEPLLRRSVNRPVMCSWGVLNYFCIYFISL